MVAFASYGLRFESPQYFAKFLACSIFETEFLSGKKLFAKFSLVRSIYGWINVTTGASDDGLKSFNK